MCGDARSRPDVETPMAGDKARMAFADPPYNLEIASFQGRGSTQHREFLVASGEQTREEFIGFLRETFGEHRGRLRRRRHRVHVHGLAPHGRDAGRRSALVQELRLELSAIAVKPTADKIARMWPNGEVRSGARLTFRNTPLGSPT